jgi:hypothetical protein
MRRRQTPPGLYAIRGVMGFCHLLVDDASAVLLDVLDGALHRRRFDRLLQRRLAQRTGVVRGSRYDATS